MPRSQIVGASVTPAKNLAIAEKPLKSGGVAVSF
jgi:hypothetical protein